MYGRKVSRLDIIRALIFKEREKLWPKGYDRNDSIGLDKFLENIAGMIHPLSLAEFFDKSKPSVLFDSGRLKSAYEHYRAKAEAQHRVAPQAPPHAARQQTPEQLANKILANVHALILSAQMQAFLQAQDRDNINAMLQNFFSIFIGSIKYVVKKKYPPAAFFKDPAVIRVFSQNRYLQAVLRIMQRDQHGQQERPTMQATTQWLLDNKMEIYNGTGIPSSSTNPAYLLAVFKIMADKVIEHGHSLQDFFGDSLVRATLKTGSNTYAAILDNLVFVGQPFKARNPAARDHARQAFIDDEGRGPVTRLGLGGKQGTELQRALKGVLAENHPDRRPEAEGKANQAFLDAQLLREVCGDELVTAFQGEIARVKAEKARPR